MTKLLWRMIVESVTEPREVAAAVASRYSELTSMLRAQFHQQNDVQDSLKDSLECQKKTVQPQEDFEKAEEWGEKTMSGSTRSRWQCKFFLISVVKSVTIFLKLSCGRIITTHTDVHSWEPTNGILSKYPISTTRETYM